MQAKLTITIKAGNKTIAVLTDAPAHLWLAALQAAIDRDHRVRTLSQLERLHDAAAAVASADNTALFPLYTAGDFFTSERLPADEKRRDAQV
jgi:hypothetical protein